MTDHLRSKIRRVEAILNKKKGYPKQPLEKPTQTITHHPKESATWNSTCNIRFQLPCTNNKANYVMTSRVKQLKPGYIVRNVIQPSERKSSENKAPISNLEKIFEEMGDEKISKEETSRLFQANCTLNNEIEELKQKELESITISINETKDCSSSISQVIKKDDSWLKDWAKIEDFQNKVWRGTLNNEDIKDFEKTFNTRILDNVPKPRVESSLEASFREVNDSFNKTFALINPPLTSPQKVN